MARRRKAYLPGDIIRGELNKRGWTQTNLAERMGRPIQAVNEIIKGKKAITAATAIDLARSLRGTSAEFWLAAESAWRLQLERAKRKAKR